MRSSPPQQFWRWSAIQHSLCLISLLSNCAVVSIGEISFDDSDRECMANKPLSMIGLEDYVTFIKSDSKLSADLKFDVSKHHDANSHVAKELLKRLDADMKTYATQANTEAQPRMIGLAE